MVQKKYFTEVVLLTKTYNLQDFKDWLHWHLNIIGFQHAHIFDNESSVDIKSVCDSYGDRVSYELVTGWPNQYALYNRYIHNESPAWWVLPIDDDEFLWLSEKYHHNINNLLFVITKTHPDWVKISFGWRNLIPSKFTEYRTNKHLVLNANAYSDQGAEIWQRGNTPVKTMVLNTQPFYWSVVPYTHNPLGQNGVVPSYLLDGTIIYDNYQSSPTPTNSDAILYHYQFKCNNEWVYKCIQRKSAASTIDWKNHPEIYINLYGTTPYSYDNRAIELWNKSR